MKRAEMYVSAMSSYTAADAAGYRAMRDLNATEVTIIQATITGTDGLYLVELEHNGD